MLRMISRCAVVGAVLTSGIPAVADVPSYDNFQLQARSNLAVNVAEGTFNLDGDVFFTNGTPVLNNAGQFAIRLSLIQNTNRQGILSGSNALVDIVYQTLPGDSLSDPTINENGLIIWPQTFSSQNGLFFYNTISDTSGVYSTQPFGSSAWSGATVNNNGEVGFRATFSTTRAFYSFDGVSTAGLHIAEVGLDPQSPYSFLFTPTMNNARQIASQVRLGGPGQTGNGQPDQIRVFEVGGASTLIAEDVNSNAASPYAGFDSSAPALMDDGRVVFIATLAAGGRGVFLSDGLNTVTIATTNDPDVSEIEFFPPAVNANGLVAFRGVDGSGLQAVFVGDGTDLLRVIGEHDLVDTDFGPMTGRIDQNDSSTVFGGAIGLNDFGDVAFNCALTPAGNNQIEWGSGIYIGYARRPGDANGDRVVDVFDLLAILEQWGPCNVPCPPACDADVNTDCSVDIFDMLESLDNWTK